MNRSRYLYIPKWYLSIGYWKTYYPTIRWFKSSWYFAGKSFSKKALIITRQCRKFIRPKILMVFYEINQWKLLSGDLDNALLPATPLACIAIIGGLIENITGKNIVVVWRGRTVWKNHLQTYLYKKEQQWLLQILIPQILQNYAEMQISLYPQQENRNYNGRYDT